MPIRMVIVMILLLAAAASGCQASADNWDLYFHVDQGAWGLLIGVQPAATDSYDGQATGDPGQVLYGICMALYRENGEDWSGPTGFYSDFMAPIPSGSSKTWSDIYLWSQNWTPTLGNRVGMGRTTSQAAPAGYWASLVIDYVPASLNWTGPMRYDFPLDRHGVGVGYFPVPITSNPYDPMQVTRLHLTVYAPEPSSFLALLAGLGGVGGMVWRRRR